MDPLSEEKGEISGKDFALDLVEKAMAFMKSLEIYHDKSDEELFKDYLEDINEFNKEIFKIIQKLPIRVMGTLLHQMAAYKCLDPNCKIEISNQEIRVFVQERGTVQ